MVPMLDGVVGRELQGLRGPQAVAVPPGVPAIDIGRDQVARLMRDAGIHGVLAAAQDGCSPPARTRERCRPPDLVERDFTADGSEPVVGHRPDLRPDVVRRWPTCASSSTCSPGRSSAGASRRTCGPTWSSTRSRWPAGHAARTSPGCVAHSDAGSQFTSMRFTERLAEIGARPSIGSVADSYDNALAETINGLLQDRAASAGPTAPPGTTSTSVELATLGWVHWHNPNASTATRRRPPAEFEAAFYAAQQADPDRGWKPIARASIKPRAIQPTGALPTAPMSRSCRGSTTTPVTPCRSPPTSP